MTNKLDSIKYILAAAAISLVQVSCEPDALSEFESVTMQPATTLSLEVSNVICNSATINYTISGLGRIHYAVLPDGEEAPTADDLLYLSLNNAASSKGVKISELQGSMTIDPVLLENQAYKIFAITTNADGVVSEVVSTGTFTTKTVKFADIPGSYSVAVTSPWFGDYTISATIIADPSTTNGLFIIGLGQDTWAYTDTDTIRATFDPKHATINAADWQYSGPFNYSNTEIGNHYFAADEEGADVVFSIEHSYSTGATTGIISTTQVWGFYWDKVSGTYESGFSEKYTNTVFTKSK